MLYFKKGIVVMLLVLVGGILYLQWDGIRAQQDRLDRVPHEEKAGEQLEFAEIQRHRDALEVAAYARAFNGIGFVLGIAFLLVAGSVTISIKPQRDTGNW